MVMMIRFSLLFFKILIDFILAVSGLSGSIPECMNSSCASQSSCGILVFQPSIKTTSPAL